MPSDPRIQTSNSTTSLHLKLWFSLYAFLIIFDSHSCLNRYHNSLYTSSLIFLVAILINRVLSLPDNIETIRMDRNWH